MTHLPDYEILINSDKPTLFICSFLSAGESETNNRKLNMLKDIYN